MRLLPSDLLSRAQVLRHDYLNAKVIENGFPEDLLDAIAAEIAKIDQAHLISSLDDRQIKQEASEGLGPATRQFLELVDSENFRNFIPFIRPQAHELTWLSIPWQTDLREACRLAAKEQKPISLWAMNGNPLGWT